MACVGVIGTGLVGSGLAKALAGAGFSVVAHDIATEKVSALAELGVAAAESPAGVAARADRVILSLMTPAIIRDVLFGKGGITTSPRLPGIVIDTSTGSPDDAARFQQELAVKGVEYLEAPISGTSAQIAGKEGVFLVGGRREAFVACKDIFDALGGKAVHIGDAGSGARAKLAINLVLGLNRAALAEGLVFASAMGIDGKAFLDLLKQTPAHSAVADLKGPKMVSGDFSAQGKLAQHRKDVGLMVEAARGAGHSLPFTEFHAKLLDGAIAAGDGDLDNSAVIKEIRRRWEKGARPR
ncbi:MAG: NAD(P)-dependent oxidoreductase [Candidatus Lokiarchaeota archaeon]|nr:NAD(P)-dependent oxidoreductase [Candidatus Lokiarchaeota archaeon]